MTLLKTVFFQDLYLEKCGSRQTTVCDCEINVYTDNDEFHLLFMSSFFTGEKFVVPQYTQEGTLTMAPAGVYVSEG